VKNQRTIEEYSYGRCLARAAAAHASVDRPREISAAAAAAHQQGARRDEAQAAAGGSGGVWWRPPLRAEDEHAVIVAALAHVVGEGRQAQQQQPPPVLGHGQQGTHVLAHGPTCSALRFCFLLFLIFEILASLLVVLSVDELIFFLNE
jgi:hypothetical protein